MASPEICRFYVEPPIFLSITHVYQRLAVLCAYILIYAHSLFYKILMARVNIYLPDDVYELAQRWRGEANLSEICARAIHDEFDAREMHRAPPALLDALGSESSIERDLKQRYGLVEAYVVDTPASAFALRDVLGVCAAKYLDRNICDDSLLAIAGGRQMWCTVRHISPRRVKTTITPIGMNQADPHLLHVHPNSLATFLWLLYSPRSSAHIIGSDDSAAFWEADLPKKDHAAYFVIASCDRFEPTSSFARLLGEHTTAQLTQSNVLGDFAYSFVTGESKVFSPSLGKPEFKLQPEYLQNLSRRQDARVILVAGGPEKLKVIQCILILGLCNVLITDSSSASVLIGKEVSPHEHDRN